MSGVRVGDSPISATTRALLVAEESERRALLDPSIVDVSHGEGVPIGTLGSGHSVFGRSGFQRLAFRDAPDMGPDFHNPRLRADFGFYLVDGNQAYVLQDKAMPPRATDAPATAARPMDRVFAYAGLPKAHFRFEHDELDLGIVATAYSPLIAHDLESSSTPVQIFEITIHNPSTRRRPLEVRLSHLQDLVAKDGIARLFCPGGEIAFSSDGGSADERGPFVRFVLPPGELRTERFFVAWFIPEFRTPSPAATATYRRHYASRFANACEVVLLAREKAEDWSAAIDAWRASFDVPAEMKRLWFSSLSSVITSTMLSDDPFFFAIESPHEWVNTMDVAVYANWIYLVNWPELERADIDQYLSVIATEGDRAGFVWHSLWVDAAHYSEEPTFLARLWRAYLWLGDPRLLEEAYDTALAAANYAYGQGSFESLLSSQKGNQSYDEWMMPGASAYVNIAWLYGLHALARMGQRLGRAASVGGVDIDELTRRVRSSLIERLWTDDQGGYFRCFYRTPGSSDASVADAVFTDQLFGLWVLLIEDGSEDILGRERIAAALRTIRTNNLLEDEATGFRGWVNGMLPGRQPDLVSGYHARTCWLGAQLDLASLLGAAGDEASSLDVFRSSEASLGRNHLTVGEWNRAIDAERNVVVLEEWGKDTPRFPPYPRYTSSWEYLVRMLGLRLDETHLYLAPFRSLRFELCDVLLAGVRLSIRVEPRWNRVFANGVETTGLLALRRDAGAHRVEFLRSGLPSDEESLPGRRSRGTA